MITWQRSYEDALAVSRETRKPILVCINMDGEIASEHYAGVRYRQVEIAALYEPYVCVIASVYRHTPRDYDEQGRRIPCPRFGGVTCGEHIAIEPGLFGQFMDGKRIAPRHIGVELDSREMYDAYYAWDTQTIFDTLRDGIQERTTVPVRVVREDRPLIERVKSRDVVDRTAVETAWLRGDREQRRVLIEAARAQGAAAPIELLRLAVFSFDVELAQLARRALVQSGSESAIELINEALRVPMDTTERDALIAALVRLGESFPRAATLAAVHQGLAGRSSVIDAESLSKALESARAPRSAESSAPRPADDHALLETRLESAAGASEAEPTNGGAQLDLAESFVAVAVDPRTTRKYARVLFEDARDAARRARELGQDGWRTHAVLAIAAWNLGEVDEARARAEAAVRQLGAGADSWNGAAVLAMFAEGRQQSIVRAWREKSSWPATWLTDVHAAYAVLAHHPLGTDAHVVAHYDFLRWLGASGTAERVLDEGLARFPDAWLLHDRLRTRQLAERGVEGLQSAYAEVLAASEPDSALLSFAGYAALVAAEFHRRAGHPDKALGAYADGVAHYENSIRGSPGGRATADHFVSLALAGRARIHLERGQLQLALEEIRASFERKPEAAATQDGLNISPVDTAKMLRARLAEAGRDDLVATLQAALDRLDPQMLLLPAYESEGPRGTSADGRPPRRRGQPPR